MSSVPRSGGYQTRTIAGIVIFLLGVGLIAHPIYTWHHYGEQSDPLFAEPLSEPPEEYVEFESLPPEVRPTVREAIKQGEVRVWSGEDPAAYRTLRGMGLLHDHINVRYQDSYYRIGLYYTTNTDFVGPLIRWLLTAVAAFLIVYGSMLWFSGSWRPFTPSRALWLPVFVTVAFFATNAYDVTYGGVRGSFLDIHRVPIFVPLLPLASLFFVVGAEVATNGTTSWRIKAVGAGAVVIGIASLTVIHPQALVVMLAGLTLLGIPWLIYGYLLTDAPI